MWREAVYYRGMTKAPVIDLSQIPALQRDAVAALMHEVAALRELAKRQEAL